MIFSAWCGDLNKVNKELPANTTVSHYRIVAKLGAGGMGEVYLAEDTRLGRQVVLKILPADFTLNADRVRRFKQEAKAASALNHPNIITVHDIGESETGHFIVMELVAGRTLRAVIAEDNSLETLLTLGAQMAKALDAAHAAGITHRDLKPDNIMVRDDGYVKVLDFGLARLRPAMESDSEAATLAQQTTPGTIMGTIAYMSPEQARGETVGHPSDVFALGIVLYELATGRHPFKAETLLGYLHAITLQTPAPPQQWQPKLPAALNDLLLRMLAKDASRRPTASEVAQALQAIERGGDPARGQSVENATMLLPSAGSGAAPADEGFWVAVLPFKWRGANAELEALAEGLSEDIVTGLSRFSYLRVIARSSTLRYAGDSSDVRAIGKELGARYVMEGSLRQAGTKLRLAVQLVDTTTGAHLWAENYERSFSPDAIFELQDDLVPRIVSTVADQYGALVHSMSESLRGRSAASYSAHEAVLRGFGYLERLTPEEHCEVREILEAAVESAPNHSDCLAMLSVIYDHEHAYGYNVRPNPLGRAHAAAQRAVAAAPASLLAHYALATVLFFQKDFSAFRTAAERTLALNRMDASTTAGLGLFIAEAGDWEYGLGVVERAIELNPHHPGWYHFPAFFYAYHRRDYRGALAIALKINIPGYLHTHTALAAVYGQLGEQERARAALRELRALAPDFGVIAREAYGKWLDAELTEHLIDGLRKAGLAIDGEAQVASSQPATDSSETAAPSLATSDTQPATSPTQSIAVLPFANISADEENEYFCDGLAEELLNALAKIDELKVAARTSAFSFKGKNTEAREIGKTLNVNTVLEGSVRKAGNRVRINVQLVNAADGYHLWSERYDREMKDIFDVQDEITLAVVDALKVKLLGAKKAAVLKRHTDNTEAYQLYLQGRFHYGKWTEEGFRKAIKCYEQALAHEPNYAPAFGGLAYCCYCLWWFGHLPPAESGSRAREAIAKALALDPALAEAQLTLANIKFYFEHDWLGAERNFKQALELSPNYVDAHLAYGLFLGVMGRQMEAVAQGMRALELDPLSLVTNINVGWIFWIVGQPDRILAQGRKLIELEPNFFGGHTLLNVGYWMLGDYEQAISNAQKAWILGDRRALSSLGSGYGILGEQDKARQTLEELQALSAQRYIQRYDLAIVHAGLGEMDRAFELLEQAYEQREGILVFLKQVDLHIPGLSADPRFADLLRRIGLPE